MLRSLDEIPVMMQVEVPARVIGLSACVVLTSRTFRLLSKPLGCGYTTGQWPRE